MPALPINIAIMSTYFPAVLTSGVKPVDKPTVLAADTCSKIISIKSKRPEANKSASVMAKAKMPTRLPIAKKIKMEYAFITVSLGMLLLKSSVRFFPCIVATTEAHITANVEVLMPPPAEPEDAPTNIKNKKMISTGRLMAEVSTTLNPALRVVIDW